MATIASKLQEDLISDMAIEQVFQKHVVDGASFFFHHHIKEPNHEYALRHNLAEALGVSINDVVIIGSGKLGFSVKNSKFNTFDHKYNETRLKKDRSDIDIAIVNRKIYDQSAEEIFHLSKHYSKDWIRHNWTKNSFYPNGNDLFQNYTQYLARGWLRPDFVPLIFYNQWKWRSIINDWKIRLDGRKISLGFYSDWHYLKWYHMDNLETLRIKIKSLDLNK